MLSTLKIRSSQGIKEHPLESSSSSLLVEDFDAIDRLQFPQMSRPHRPPGFSPGVRGSLVGYFCPTYPCINSPPISRYFENRDFLTPSPSRRARATGLFWPLLGPCLGLGGELAPGVSTGFWGVPRGLFLSNMFLL